jgi:long-chain acyl-CoA synthetase
MDWLEKEGCVSSMLLDPLIFSKIKNMVGGKLRIVFSSSGPLHNEIIKFLKISFCADFISIYGQSESTFISCMSYLGEPQT